MTGTPSPTSRFPPTSRTWIEEQIDDGSQGIATVNRFLMEVYFTPLCASVRASSWRRRFDADDLVQSFFASRLGSPEYLTRWSASGLPLRHWLLQGLRYHAHERIRDDRPPHHGLDLDRVPSADDPPLVVLDRYYARAVVQTALERARLQCETEGLAAHWQAFHDHHYEDRTFVAVGEAGGIDPERARTMSRVAEKRFRSALRVVVARDGATTADIDRQIDELIDALQ